MATSVIPPSRTPLDWLKTEDTAVPMLPSVALRVIELVSDPDVTVVSLSPVVSKDQVLASRVIGLANSAAYAGFHPATTLIEAMVRLGTVAVRNVVVTVSFASRMHDPRIYGERGRELVDPVAAFLGLDQAWLDATDSRAPGLYDVARQLLS